MSVSFSYYLEPVFHKDRWTWVCLPIKPEIVTYNGKATSFPPESIRDYKIIKVYK